MLELSNFVKRPYLQYYLFNMTKHAVHVMGSNYRIKDFFQKLTFLLRLERGNFHNILKFKLQ